MKRHKYNARKTELEGITFDSKKEAKRYEYLKQLEMVDIISHLKLQVEYELLPAVRINDTIKLKTKGKSVIRTIQRPITYKADFEYIKNGELITEDVKASPKMIPADFKLKEKLFFYKYRRRIKRVFKYDED